MHIPLYLPEEKSHKHTFQDTITNFNLQLNLSKTATLKRPQNGFQYQLLSKTGQKYVLQNAKVFDVFTPKKYFQVILMQFDQ